MAQGFYIGPVKVENPLILAPMEDVSNLAFRLIAKRIGKPGLMFTEFVSAMAIHHGAIKTLRKMRIDASERPLGIQIFGSQPEVMAETARIAEQMGADILDINMGCWVPKVCRTGSGAALLNDPDQAEAIVSAVVKAVRIPVTVKVRAGWSYAHFAAPELAKRFEGAGAKMLTLHARFAKQGFEGEADWSLIAQLREALSIPLIGNGDVKTPEDAIKMMRETGCDGVMVGRAAISNPWALGRIHAGLMGEVIPEEPSLEERIKVAKEHARLMVALEIQAESLTGGADLMASPDEELRALRALRGQLPMYIKGVPGSPLVRAELSRVSSLKEIDRILDDLLESSRSGMEAGARL